MRSPVSEESAKAKVVHKYQKLYPILMELVDLLQLLEPGGTLVDDVTLMRKDDGGVRVAYVARPVVLTIDDGKRRFILKVIEGERS
jgi:hypothetical protein